MDDELRQASQRRLDFLDALIKAQGDLPGLIALVMSSADNASAEAAVARRFGISTEHATGVLDMQVRRMSAQGRARFVDERDALAAFLADG